MTSDPRELLLLLDDAPATAAPVRVVRGRLQRRHRTQVLGAVVGVAVLAGATVLVEAPSTESAPVADRAVTEERGVRLTLVLDDPDVRLGQTLHATVTVENLSGADAAYASDSCRALADVALVTDETPAPGRTWEGPAAAFKQQALRDRRPQQTGFGDRPVAPEGPPSLCASVGLTNPLPAGEVQTRELYGQASLPEGGSPAGPGRVTAVFHLLRDPASFSGEVPVEVALPVRVEGEGSLSRAEVVDAALGDDRFRAWLLAQPRAVWSNAFAFRDPEDRGAWRVGLFREGPGVRGSGTVSVDAASGEVRSRDLP